AASRRRPTRRTRAAVSLQSARGRAPVRIAIGEPSMRTTHRAGLLAAAITLIATNEASAFSCNRHVKNDSDCSWTITADPDPEVNVYFQTDMCGTVRRGGKRKRPKVPV